MYLAIDIGATKTLIACFSRGGRLLRRAKFPTNHNQNTFLKDLAAQLADFRTTPIHAVTVAIPGIVQKNCSFTFGNLPWRNIDLLTPLQSFFNCPVYFVNDADLATIYESYFCSGRLIYLTFSTGIGGGIAESGQLLPSSATFEPGHVKYTWAGHSTEWEDFASANAIRLHFGKKVSHIRAKKDFTDIAQRLTPGIVDIINQYHPSTIVVGGPLGLIFSKFKKPLRAALLTHLEKSSLPKIISARRPTESVVYGAYLYARYHKS